MSLLKWKEMAERRSELGQRINAGRETIKKQSIADQMGQVEAAKLFEPITSGLRDISAPKAPLRRLKKKGVVPDYGLTYSFSTSTLTSFSFTQQPRRVQYNPVNKNTIQSIRVCITDGKRRIIDLNHSDTVFSLILREKRYD